jgi:hypothetical protein
MARDKIEKLKAAMASATNEHLRKESERLRAEIGGCKGDRLGSELTETEVAAKELANSARFSDPRPARIRPANRKDPRPFQQRAIR